ncbi:IAP-1 [Pieris rapae granulovirus Wuhan]|uniref:IAP-1 n=1 Tax=Pieris rapae granulovirus Wuhan TaxID=2848030 RepID=D2J4P6_9BBAC|nr:IAP-1 [Betabaculovirus arrapae]ACZ63565.1 IAP-1 [Betabaculovirus arrapae]UOS85753.1 IAP-1 [Pieris rapae granulovirus]
MSDDDNNNVSFLLVIFENNSENLNEKTNTMQENEDVKKISDKITILKAKQPKLSSKNARLKTFDTWPVGIAQTKDEMATAGYYYTGISDEVKCFFCDGGINEWYPKDDPWKQHALWFAGCQFLIASKGLKYIEQVHDEEKNKIVTNQQKNNNILENMKETVQKDDLKCVICFENPRNMLLLPCKHINLCGQCMCSLDNQICPICRNYFTQFVEVYIN